MNRECRYPDPEVARAASSPPHNAEAREVRADSIPGGTCWSRRLGDGDSSADVLRLDWSLARVALDEGAHLVRLVDAPHEMPMAAAEALYEPLPMSAPDAMPAPESLLGSRGIEIETRVVLAAPVGSAIGWDYSPSLKRLRGQVAVSPVLLPLSNAFTRYLLRLNAQFRYARLGCTEAGLALQVVLPSADARWQALGHAALGAIQQSLRPQVEWWTQPGELVADLFDQVEFFSSVQHLRPARRDISSV